MKPTIAFFGTPQESVTVVSALKNAGYTIGTVVTKPPRPIGRKQILTETATAHWAKENHVPLMTPETNEEVYWKYKDEEKLIAEVLSYKPELIVVADYTQKIPMKLIEQMKYGGLNVHPSLLPSYRGPAPVPWALLNGETKTGVSIVTLAEQFDEGIVIAQKEEIINSEDTTTTLLPRLFEIGAKLLVDILPEYLKTLKSLPPYILYTKYSILPSSHPRISRDDGFEPWEKINEAIEMGKDAQRIYNKWRGFHPWPGLWSRVQLTGNNNQKSAEKRMKILECELTDEKLKIKTIQLEGKTPTLFSSFLLSN